MKHITRIFGAVLFLTALLFSCETPGSGSSVDGTWNGSWEETFQGAGTFDVTATVDENGGVVTGTADVEFTGAYTITGTIAGNNFDVTLTRDADPTYIITATGSYSGDVMSGTWEDNDAPQMGGTFTMTR
ncbi:MAG: hypothetical protein JW822_08525 [Spirochaetales bacterium]|nr:hypothetical protein [Spirochaetales bacterium]